MRRRVSSPSKSPRSTHSISRAALREELHVEPPGVLRPGERFRRELPVLGARHGLRRGDDADDARFGFTHRGKTAGSIPTTGIESLARRGAAQTAVAVLQARTSALMFFASRNSTRRPQRSRMKSSVRSPQGAKPQSAAKTRSSWGRAARTARVTERPPKPESRSQTGGGSACRSRVELLLKARLESRRAAGELAVRPGDQRAADDVEVLGEHRGSRLVVDTARSRVARSSARHGRELRLMIFCARSPSTQRRTCQSEECS